MNVLVLCPADSSGYGEAGARLALALDREGVDVVVRGYTPGRECAHPGLGRLLDRPLRGPFGLCLQVTLPHLMRAYGRLPCVGYFFWETDQFRASSWARRLDPLALVLGPAPNTLAACRASGVTAPLAEVPLPCDPADYERSYDTLPAFRHHRRAGTFVFYTVGEWVRRKGLMDLLLAYYAEFRAGEGVHLVVKTHRTGVSPADLAREFRSFSGKVMDKLRLHGDPDRYPPVTLVPHHLSREETFQLHCSCDCYVSASYGEGFSLTGFDAACLGRTPVVPRHSGYPAWADDSACYRFETSPDPCLGVVDSFADLYRGDESWHRPCPFSLRRALRQAYEERGTPARRAKAAAGAALPCRPEFGGGRRLAEVLARCPRTSPAG